MLGDVYDGEPGIDRALRVQGPGGHVFKLFCGMETAQVLEPGDRPIKFEHASVKARNPRPVERFLQDGLGFKFSDRMGSLASWWHCDADHHGMAVVRAPKYELSHYAYAYPDLSAIGRVADRLKRHRDQKLIWGISRHGPGNNHFAYFHDNDGAMIELCSDLARCRRSATTRRASGRSTRDDQPVGRTACPEIPAHRLSDRPARPRAAGVGEASGTDRDDRRELAPCRATTCCGRRSAALLTWGRSSVSRSKSGVCPASTYELVTRAACLWPDRPAVSVLTDAERFDTPLTLTFAQLARDVHQAAAVLAELGIGRGDAVAVVSVNCATMLPLLLAAEAVGIFAPINPGLSADHATELVRRSGARVVAASGPELDPTAWALARAVAQRTGARALLAMRPTAVASEAPALEPLDGVEVAYLEERMADADDGALPGPPPSSSDIASYLHTGGTTGTPKLAARTPPTRCRTRG